MLERRSKRHHLHADQFQRTSSERIVDHPEKHRWKVEKGDSHRERQLVLRHLSLAVLNDRLCLIGSDRYRRSDTLRSINSIPLQNREQRGKTKDTGMKSGQA